jgi:hypothetical protein
MHHPVPRRSVIRSAWRMSLTWLFLGAVIGVLNGLEKSSGGDIVFMMLGGMVVLSILGLFLGIIGGDASGSVFGAAAGVLVCWFVGPFGAHGNHPGAMSVIIMIGALAGATGLLFVRFLLWKYAMIFKAIRWMAGFTPMAGTVGVARVGSHHGDTWRAKPSFGIKSRIAENRAQNHQESRVRGTSAAPASSQ